MGRRVGVDAGQPDGHKGLSYKIGMVCNRAV